MGNTFELHAHQYSLSEKYELYVPPVIEHILDTKFKHPSDIYMCFKTAMDKELLFSFLLKKNQFIIFT